MRCTAMAEDKEPERKKLSLQGNNKLSLGSTQEIIRKSRQDQQSASKSQSALLVESCNLYGYQKK